MKAKCQEEDKAIKTNLTKMLRGKERKKRKNSCAQLNRGRQRRFIYVKY